MITNTNRHSRGKKSKTATIINSTLLGLYTGLVGVLVYLITAKQFLNFRNVNMIIFGMLLIVWLVACVCIIRKKAKVFTGICLVLFSLGTIGLLFTYKSAADLTEKFNRTASYSEIEMSIVVAKDSPINNITELTEVQSPLTSDKENIETLLGKVRVEKKVDLTPVSATSYQAAYETIMKDTSKAMVLNSAYSSLLELNDADYASKLKTLYTYKISKQVSLERQAEKVKNPNVFNIYISGIDTYGSISTVSRSDVNIIMTVNMETHKVLLTTTPRDSYVKIPGGGAEQYDKLTHAGVYGVETSMKTLENLYGIDIDYYARINFTSFMQLIDAVGGVEVNNPTAFSAGGYDYPAGVVQLNSESALRYVRERYSLSGGDHDRGKNQERVIAAIIKKLATFQSLTKISDVITSLQDSVQTNMSLDNMMAIANAQLSSGGQFTVTSQAVTGTGSTGELPSYAMPGYALYMLSLDQASVDTAKEAINTTMEEK
ncbi:LCP family protein [Streptococcus sp. 20-1249]|uniref:LCP family glycopolymer transferase CpsA n=1 Tax=Streptococcus hepaticus TaxID=3349163 RepID=UPI003748C5E5